PRRLRSARFSGAASVASSPTVWQYPPEPSMATPDMRAPRRIAAVDRAVALLFALAESGGELGTNELGRRLGVDASTASRLLATLATRELVEQVPASGRY